MSTLLFYLFFSLLLIVSSAQFTQTDANNTSLRHILTGLNATKLIELFDAYGLDNYLNNSQQSVTVLAPPNEGLDETLVPQNEIKEWLQYHIIDRRYQPDELVDGALLVTKAGGGRLGANTSQRIRIHVTMQDKMAGSILNTGKRSIQFDRAAVNGEAVLTETISVYPVSQSVNLPRDVLDRLPTNLDLSTFVASVYASGSSDVIQYCRGMTLFVPTNAAFERLGLLTKYLLQPNNKSKLAQVIRFHAIQGVYYKNEMSYGEHSVPTLSHGGKDNRQEDIHLNKTEKGIFLRGYGAEDGNDRSVIGKVLEEEEMLLKNGLAIKVDRVQLPSLLKVTNHDLLESSGTTNSFLDLMEKAQLTHFLDSDMNGSYGYPSRKTVFTILAPSDRAFAKMNFTRLLEDQDLLNRIARLHILPVAIPQITLLGETEHPSAHGSDKHNTKRLKRRADEHQEISTGGTEFDTLYDGEKVVITLEKGDTKGGSAGLYTLKVKGSIQEKAEVINMGRVTNGGGVIEIDRVLLPSDANNMLALSWWSFLLIVLSVLTISAFIVGGGYYLWLLWKRRREGYSAIEEEEQEQQQQQHGNEESRSGEYI